MEQEDIFDPMQVPVEAISQDVTSVESFAVEQTIERVPYAGIWTDLEVEE